MPFIPVLVLSLPRAVERRTRIAEHLRRLGVAFEFVDGIDGKAMSETERCSLLAEGVQYHPGVVGCYLAHLRAFSVIVERSLPVALVLEDDAMLDPRFLPALRQGHGSLDFDFCLLDYHDHNDSGHVFYNHADGIEVFPGFAAYATHGGPVGLNAYLVTREAAATRLAHAFPIRRPIDIYSALPYQPRFRAVVPPQAAGVSEESMRSLITQRDHFGQLRFRWIRRLPGFYDLRDALSPKLRALRRQVPELVRQGSLPVGGDWRPLPPGRRILG